MTRYPLRWCFALVLASCGDDEPASSGTTETADDTTTEASSTEAGSTTTGSSSSASHGDTSTGDPGESESGSESSSTGAAVDCDALPPGPFAATRLFEELDLRGSEDLGFDGAGGFAARSGARVVRVTADGELTELVPNLPSSWGLRHLASGVLLLAAYQSDRIIAIDPSGETTDYGTGLGSVNGIYPDFDGTVWYTNLSLVGRLDASGNATPIVQGGAGQGANGIVRDPGRGLLFYSTYSGGALYRVPIAEDGEPGTPVLVGDVDGTSFDGITLDACGNVYAVDQPNGRIFRFWLDDEGAAIGDAEPLLEAPVPTSIANAQFGTGDGFDADALYAIGDGGGFYRIDVGAPGAAYVVPEG